MPLRTAGHANLGTTRALFSHDVRRLFGNAHPALACSRSGGVVLRLAPELVCSELTVFREALRLPLALCCCLHPLGRAEMMTALVFGFVLSLTVNGHCSVEIRVAFPSQLASLACVSY